MKIESRATAGSIIFLILGWVISVLPILAMGVGGTVMALTNRAEVTKGMVKYGYPENATNIILGLEIGSAIIYAIPQTAVLGAILMTGYLGGAVATHVRAGEPTWYFAVIVGVLVWLGLFLRDKRLRVLLPFRR